MAVWTKQGAFSLAETSFYSLALAEKVQRTEALKQPFLDQYFHITSILRLTETV